MTGHHPWSTIRDRSKDTPDERAEMAEMRRGMEAVIRLEQMRKARGLSQADVGAAIGINQQTVSKIERSDNPYLDTIREYVEGLGGELRLVAVFPDDTIEFAVPTR